MKEKFKLFCEENPLDFDKEQLKKVEGDILNRKNVVSDEYVDFILWQKGLKSRQEYFCECVEKLFPLEKYPHLLEVGAGKNARLSKMLSEKGYRMTAIDPKIAESSDFEKLKLQKDTFLCGITDISSYDAIIAQEPCEATEHIIRACVKQEKDFFISLCGTPHTLINGETPETVFDWYQYLDEIAGESSLLFRMDMIPNYITYVIIHRSFKPNDSEVANCSEIDDVK